MASVSKTTIVYIYVGGVHSTILIVLGHLDVISNHSEGDQKRGHINKKLTKLMSVLIIVRSVDVTTVGHCNYLKRACFSSLKRFNLSGKTRKNNTKQQIKGK